MRSLRVVSKAVLSTLVGATPILSGVCARADTTLELGLPKPTVSSAIRVASAHWHGQP
jgi:hypothetical protein